MNRINDMLYKHRWSYHTQQGKLWTNGLFWQFWQFHLFWNDLTNIRQHCNQRYAMTKQNSPLEMKTDKISIKLEILVLNKRMSKNHPKELGRAKSDQIEDWSRCDLRWNLNRGSKMQENCKQLTDEEMMSHQLCGRGCVKLSNCQMVRFNTQENCQQFWLAWKVKCNRVCLLSW